MLNRSPTGMFAFTIVWVGQAVSLLGTSMSAFALTIWAYELTGKATALALAGFFHVTPLLIFSPIAGAIVDRSNRKLMMMLSDLGSGIATIGILVLFLTGQLELWHLFAANAVMGVFQTFQWPAYSAAITMIVPKKHYARAHAMNDLAGNTSGIFAPLLAGALLPFIGLGGILTIDIVTFLVAIGALLVVRIPQPEETEEGLESRGSIWKESAFGFRYIFKRPSLLGLQTIFYDRQLLCDHGLHVDRAHDPGAHRQQFTNLRQRADCWCSGGCYRWINYECLGGNQEKSSRCTDRLGHRGLVWDDINWGWQWSADVGSRLFHCSRNRPIDQ